MKHTTQLILALVLLAPMPVFADSAKPLPKPQEINIPEGVNPDLVKEAGNKAVKALMADFLARTDIPIKRFAVLPLERDMDGGYFTMQLRNEFASEGNASGYELYTRMDDEWNTILNEIAWGQTYGDTMDPATVQKFGRIQGVQGLIMGRVSGVEKYGDDDVKVRFSAQFFEVETGRLLWGEEKVAYGRHNDDGSVNWTKLSDRKYERYGLIGLGCVVGLLVLARVSRALGSASRPR